MGDTSDAYTRVTWRGVRLNKRTRAALQWAEKKCGIRIEPSQGSYNAGGVTASAGTHDGGGAVDIRTRHLTRDQRVKLVRALKDAGFAAWFRKDGWDGKGGGQHIHALAIGDRDMAAGARTQVTSFDAGRDGLRGNRVDNTYRPNPRKRFSYAKNRPVNR